MKNKQIVAILMSLIIVATVLAMSMPVIGSKQAITNTDWQQFHKDAQHTGFSTSTAPDTNEILWISDDIGAVASSSPVVAEGKVFVNCGDVVKALNEYTGEYLSDYGPGSSRYGSWASPCYHDEKIWCGMSGSVNGGTMVADGKVFAGNWDGHQYYCWDEETGELLWTFTEENTGLWGTAYAQGTPAYADGKVYLTTWVFIGGHVYCVDADTGEEIWHQTLPLDACGSPTIANGIVYVTTYNFYGDGDIYALDTSTGAILWQHTIQGTDSTPAVAYGNVYVTGGSKGFSDIQTYCFDATTGTPIWETNVSDTIGGWTCSVAVADGKVFVGKPGGWFGYAGTYALDAFTGGVIWSYPAGGSSPAVADGIVFTIGDGKVYAFGNKIPATVRIEPETLNLNDDEDGVFTAFITLPDGCDVADINVSTVECEDAPALNGTISASGSGTLVVKFDRADLKNDLPVGDAVEMTVTGERTNGTRFEGSDTVRVIAKGA